MSENSFQNENDEDNQWGDWEGEDDESEEEYYSNGGRRPSRRSIPGASIPMSGTSAVSSTRLRGGRQSLNMLETYCPKWTFWDGIRELVQNWRDGLLKNGGSFDDVEITESVKAAKITFWAKRNGLTLGRIVFTPPKPTPNPAEPSKSNAPKHTSAKTKGKLEIINNGVSLTRDNLALGVDSKRSNKKSIGGHGEGMKVGVNVLMRDNRCKVTYTTNSEKWKFYYEERKNRMLHVQFVPDSKNKAAEKETITKVVIEGLDQDLKLDDIGLDRFLFLRKSSGTTLPSESANSVKSNGYLILDGPFQHCIFIAGIFLHRKQSETGFHYGYCLPIGIAINRDRTLVDDEATLSQYTFALWKIAFESADSSNALRLYLDLLDNHKLCQDIRYAREDLSDHPDIARLLFKELRSLHGPDCWFYDGDSPDAHDAEGIIQRSLGKVPKRISTVIWEALLQLDIVMSPEQARQKAFGDSVDSRLAIDGPSNPFVRHTLHLFKCFLSLHPCTRSILYKFKTCGKRIDIDIMKFQHKDDPNVKPEPDSKIPPFFFLNDRMLSVTRAHPRKKHSCVMYVYAAPQGIGNVICDCAAHRLVALINAEVLADEKQLLKDMLMSDCYKIAAQMPREVSCELEGADLMIRWNVRETAVQGESFFLRISEVSKNLDKLFSTASNDSERYAVDDSGDSDDEDGNGLLHNEEGASPGGESLKPKDELSDNQISALGAEEDCPSDADTESVMDMDVEPRQEYTFRTSHRFWNFDDYKPATKYMVQVRADSILDTQFFSVPFYFSTPPRTPTNVSVSQHQDSILRVSWDISDGADSYLVVFNGERAETFEVNSGDTSWSGIPSSDATDVTVFARCTTLDKQSSGTTHSLVPSPKLVGDLDVGFEHEILSDLTELASAMSTQNPQQDIDGAALETSNHADPARTSTTQPDDSDDDSDNEPFPPMDVADISTSTASVALLESRVFSADGGDVPPHLPSPVQNTPHTKPTSSLEPGNKRKREPSPHRSGSSPPQTQRRRLNGVTFNNGMEDLPTDYDGDGVYEEIEEEIETIEIGASLIERSPRQDAVTKRLPLPQCTILNLNVEPGSVIRFSIPSGSDLIGHVRAIYREQVSAVSFLDLVLYRPFKDRFVGWEDDQHLILDGWRSTGPCNDIGSLPAVSIDVGWFTHVERTRYQKITHFGELGYSPNSPDSFLCGWAQIGVGCGYTSFVRPIVENRHSLQEKKLSTVDIFCGAGGASLGFSQAGFNCAIGVDKDSSAISSFQKNFPGARAHFQPSEDFLADVFEQKLDSPMASVVVISPPCQPLGAEGNRNRLAESVGASLKTFPTPYYVLFDSSRLIQKPQKHKLDTILLQFLQEGYSVSYKLLTASDYHVPQHGKYLVILAARRGLALPDWPEPLQNCTPLTVRDAIADLSFENSRGAEGKMSTDITGFVSYDPNVPLIEGTYAYDLAASSRANKAISNHLTGYKPFAEPSDIASLKINFDKPAKNIKTGPNEKWACVHPERQDILTVREMARLMSYPDSFVFEGKLKDQYRLVGSSVPPSLAQACAEKIRQCLLDSN